MMLTKVTSVRIINAVLASWLFAATLFAQAGEPGAGGGVGPAPEVNRWPTMGLILVLLIAIGIASFMSSRRGHRD